MSIPKRHPLKVTVLRTMKTGEVFEQPVLEQVSHAPDHCTRLKEGQTYFIDENGECDGGFPCNWAWNDLFPVITAMQTGGHFVMKKRPGIQYSCCTDGTMPVIFKLEYFPEDTTSSTPCKGMEGNIRSPLKITVVNVLSPEDVCKSSPEEANIPLPPLKAGQTFLVTENGRCPENFPTSAWHDLNRYVLSLQLGGNFPGFREGTVYACSTDGLTPAVFRLERLPAFS